MLNGSVCRQPYQYAPINRLQVCECVLVCACMSCFKILEHSSNDRIASSIYKYVEIDSTQSSTSIYSDIVMMTVDGSCEQLISSTLNTYSFLSLSIVINYEKPILGAVE